MSPAEAKKLADEESVLLRAYGRDTSILIDRERKLPYISSFGYLRDTVFFSQEGRLTENRRMRISPSALPTRSGASTPRTLRKWSTLQVRCRQSLHCPGDVPAQHLEGRRRTTG